MANTGDKTPAPAPAPVAAPQGPRKSNFLSEVMTELKKVTWPTLPEAWRLTTVVLGVIVAVAIYVGLIDFILTVIFNRMHLIK
jgi:preprotein translocase subunit SecE